MLPESFLTQLRFSCDMENIASSYVNLKRAGRSKVGLCPFHLEKTPSFHVYEDTQSFYCFGCGAGGDVITFIMKIENLEYIEAVKFLAQRAGLPMPEDSGADDRTARQKARILEMNRETARFFHACLKSEAGKAGLSYLLGRGLTPATITRYGLGFAPDSWYALVNHLRSKGFRDEEMGLAALAVKGKKGYYDQFRNRVMFPIIDLRGNVIAFGGRVMDDSKPKYLNSSDTPVFKKSHNLFSLNFAKNATGNTPRRLILAEGYMDVVAMNQAGFPNAVATLGTALTAEQARLISRYADEVVIAYDADEAGQKATARASGLFSEVGLEARVLVITGAKDPDEYIKKYGAQRFKLLLDQSENVLENKLARLKNQYDLQTDDGKTRYLKAAVTTLAELHDTLERDIYAGRLSAETGVLKETILNRINLVNRQKYKARQKKEWREITSGRTLYQDTVNPDRAKHLKEALAEEGIIRFLMKNPDYQDYILTKISPEDFVTAFNQRVFRIILEKIKNNITPDLSNLVTDFSVEEMGRISGMLAKGQGLDTGRRELDDYIRGLLESKGNKDDHALQQMSAEEIMALYAAKKDS